MFEAVFFELSLLYAVSLIFYVFYYILILKCFVLKCLDSCHAIVLSCFIFHLSSPIWWFLFILIEDHLFCFRKFLYYIPMLKLRIGNFCSFYTLKLRTKERKERYTTLRQSKAILIQPAFILLLKFFYWASSVGEKSKQDLII